MSSRSTASGATGGTGESSGGAGTLEAAEAWLDGLINRERQPHFSYSRFGLEAIEAILARLGNPERDLSVIHIAGSKGKGSTALLAEAVLLAAGDRVGTFTSPHLVSWRERFRVDGADVEGGDLARVVDDVRPPVDSLRIPDSNLWPSFFDATTAAALLLFARKRVDHAILEVGLGGRLDSTNAVQPAVTCVTTIELEHTDKLGETHTAIAGEKAGILKPGVPCVMGRLREDAAAVVESRAAEVGAPLTRLGVDFDLTAVGEAGADAITPVRFQSTSGLAFEANLAPRGAHQLDNAAVAIEAVRSLGAHDDATIATAARRALASVSLPGRVEIVEREPFVIVDSAHTQASAESLARFLAGLGVPRTHLVLSVSLDKNLAPILDALVPGAHAVTVTRAEPIRALAPEEIAAALHARKPNLAVDVEPDPRVAVRCARERLELDTVLCVTGSVYLAGIAREVLGSR